MNKAFAASNLIIAALCLGRMNVAGVLLAITFAGLGVIGYLDGRK